jgi:hypothetical protein
LCSHNNVLLEMMGLKCACVCVCGCVFNETTAQIWLELFTSNQNVHIHTYTHMSSLLGCQAESDGGRNDIK